MAPKAEKKPAKKVAKTAKTGAKKKSKAKVESFKIYIYKVLKQVRLLCLFIFPLCSPCPKPSGHRCWLLTSHKCPPFKRLHWVLSSIWKVFYRRYEYLEGAVIFRADAGI